MAKDGIVLVTVGPIISTKGKTDPLHIETEPEEHRKPLQKQTQQQAVNIERTNGRRHDRETRAFH